jgi:hypothetical protein
MRRWLFLACLFLACLVLAGLVLAGCGDRAVGGTPCQQLCLELRPKLIDNFGVPAEKVNFDDQKWIDAETCDACWQVVTDDYSVQPTPKTCDHF